MRNNFHIILFLVFISAVLIFDSCTYRKAEPLAETFCYPTDIEKIIITKCATPGCHNTLSKDASGGLDLSSWEKLFEGARAGAAVIPFRSDQSFLVNFINTYSDLGPQQLPTMPYVPGNPNNSAPLSRDDVMLIKNWIDNGAPDCNGVVPFSSDPNRKKFYVTNQGCDLVAVFDAETKLIMRYIDVGSDPLIESPHMVRISPDGQHWYVSFIANNSRVFQKYKTSDDSFVDEVDISLGSWNTFAFTSDSKWAYLIDFSNPGRVAVVDCEFMTLAHPAFNPEPGAFVSPHGSAVSPDDNYLYITMQLENKIYKMDITSFPPSGNPINFPVTGISKPHEIAFSPDGTLYFVTCQGTNDVKVFRTLTDQFLKSIPVAADPVEMSFSLTTDNLFVSCLGGNAVSIINYIDTSFVKTITGFYSPHGIAVDDAKGVCYVVNINTDGPPPHHTSVCGGKNGFLNAISLTTLEVVPGFKPELSVFPYSIAVRK